MSAELAKRNVLCGSRDAHSIRMVTHYDVDRAGIDRALAAVSDVLGAQRSDVAWFVWKKSAGPIDRRP